MLVGVHHEARRVPQLHPQRRTIEHSLLDDHIQPLDRRSVTIEQSRRQIRLQHRPSQQFRAGPDIVHGFGLAGALRRDQAAHTDHHHADRPGDCDLHERATQPSDPTRGAGSSNRGIHASTLNEHATQLP